MKKWNGTDKRKKLTSSDLLLRNSEEDKAREELWRQMAVTAETISRGLEPELKFLQHRNISLTELMTIVLALTLPSLILWKTQSGLQKYSEKTKKTSLYSRVNQAIPLFNDSASGECTRTFKGEPMITQSPWIIHTYVYIYSSKKIGLIFY